MHRPPDSVLRAWVPAALWLAVIAWESSLLSAGVTGGFLLPLLRALLPRASQEELVFLHHLLRKLGHFAAYALMSVFLFRGWWATTLYGASAAHRRSAAVTNPTRSEKANGWGLPSWRSMLALWSARAAVLAILGTTLVATLDEWQQSFVRSRTGTLRDVLLDSAGAWFAQMVILALSRGWLRAVAVRQSQRGLVRQP